MNTNILRFSLLLLLFIPSFLFSQQMEKGFKLLEAGNNNEASEFFDAILQEYPENKTALICYARAIGLSGQSPKAISLFEELNNRYPIDKEVLLNLAESYLWNKQFTRAINTYVDINKIFNDDSHVLRSLANAYAANKDYENAYTYILQSIKRDASDETTIQSYKSIGLAYAHSLKNQDDFEKSHHVLNLLSEVHPNNKDIVLSKAYTYLTQKNLEAAKNEFLKLQHYQLDTLKSYLGLASIALQKQEFKKSLAFLNNNYFDKKELSVQDSMQRYDLIFGNLLNVKPKKAEAILNTKLKPHLSESIYSEKLIYAHLATESYSSIPTLIDNIEDKKLKQDIYLRYILEADKYKDFNSTLANLDQSLLDVYSYILLSKIKNEMSFHATTSAQYAEDNAQNISKELAIDIFAPRASTIAPFIHFKSRWLQSQTSAFTANHSTLRAGTTIRTKHNQLASLSLGLESANLQANDKTYKPSYHLSYFTKINNRHYIKLIASRSQLNYNQDLLSENILKNNIGLEHHIVSLSGIGSYSQLSRIMLNDGNSGFDAFNSLYINIAKQPVIQAGINSTLLSYKSEVKDYYSPDYVLSVSPFVKATNEYQTNSNWKYQLMASVGQQLEAGASNTKLIYSIQLKSGYQLSSNLYGEAFYIYANNNSSLNNGFSTYLTGIKLKASL